MITGIFIGLLIAITFETAVIITLLRNDAKSLTNMSEAIRTLTGKTIAIAESLRDLAEDMTRVD